MLCHAWVHPVSIVLPLCSVHCGCCCCCRGFKYTATRWSIQSSSQCTFFLSTFRSNSQIAHDALASACTKQTTIAITVVYTRRLCGYLQSRYDNDIYNVDGKIYLSQLMIATMRYVWRLWVDISRRRTIDTFTRSTHATTSNGVTVHVRMPHSLLSMEFPKRANKTEREKKHSGKHTKRLNV